MKKTWIPAMVFTATVMLFAATTAFTGKIPAGDQSTSTTGSTTSTTSTTSSTNSTSSTKTTSGTSSTKTTKSTKSTKLTKSTRSTESTNNTGSTTSSTQQYLINQQYRHYRFNNRINHWFNHLLKVSF